MRWAFVEQVVGVEIPRILDARRMLGTGSRPHPTAAPVPETAVSVSKITEDPVDRPPCQGPA
ncbi:hypothetical protein OJAG_39010 [Oerskovia enterophila]|uniref:Uncharacterized protein n=1 Tax=Oerskovia enterophila TaxID=43678 RepID=A0A163PWL4_9CELL|nr:hypothetical protein OJAG_39010 [Oerskovia enterophila]